MTRGNKLAAKFGLVTSVLILSGAVTFTFVEGALAQAAPPQPSQANQLLLSGRGTQAGSVNAVESPVPGTTTSVNTINPSVQVQGAYTGSIPGTAQMPFSGTLSLREAVQRAIRYNLGAVGMANALQQSRGQAHAARSALLPNLSGNVTDAYQTINLEAMGLNFKTSIPGLSFPTVVGPFNYTDLRAVLSQRVLDLTAVHNYRSASALTRANEFSAQDAKDLIVLAVGGAYLQVIAAQARVASGRAQLETARALYDQTSQQKNVGLVAQIDVNRSQVALMTQQQRLISLENDLSKQKINLARIAGLPPNDGFRLSDDVPFFPAPAIEMETALQQAGQHRLDLKAAATQVEAAERGLSAARAQRLPSLSFSADYGAIGPDPTQARGTYTVIGRIHLPIWEGGRISGDIEQAHAALDQRRAELQDLRGRIESEVRNAYLDLDASTNQIEVARRNLDVIRQNLDLTRQRLEAGISDNVEVVRAQESLAAAELDYINSIFAHNIAKLSLARAIGGTADRLSQFLRVQ